MNQRDPDGDEPFIEAQRERDRQAREDAKVVAWEDQRGNEVDDEKCDQK